MGVPIHQLADPVNTTVRAAAFSALVSLRYHTVEELAKLVKIKQVFEPNASIRAVYDKLYTQYREIFKKNKKVFAALNMA